MGIQVMMDHAQLTGLRAWNTPHIIRLRLYHSLSLTARLVVLHEMPQYGSFYCFQYLLVCRYKQVYWTNDLMSPPITVLLITSVIHCRAYYLTNLYIKLWKCLQSYELDNVKLPSAAEIPSILLHSIVLEITYGNWAAIWWPLVQTPSWLQSIKRRSLLHLRLKMEDLFFLFTLF